MKKITILVLSFLVLITTVGATFVYAEESNDIYTVVNYTTVHDVSLEECSEYNRYNLNESALLSDQEQDITIEDKIVELSVLVDDSDSVYSPYTIYNSVYLNQYIPMCRTVRFIEKTQNDGIYVGYTAIDDAEVVFRYKDNRLMERSIYIPSSDEAVVFFDNVVKLYTNFRKGIECKLTESGAAMLEELMDEENWDGINALPGVELLLDDEGNTFIEPERQTMFGYSNNTQSNLDVTGITNNTQLLNSLIAEFPPYTKVLKDYYSMQSAYLHAGRTVRVYETRNNYIRTSSTGQNFVEDTLLTAIGIYLGNLNISVVDAILTSVSILHNITKIFEPATLYKSGNYSYSGKRHGYVYDTTVYNDYVLTLTLSYSNSNAGGFAGGYLSNGVFDWVHQSGTLYNTTYYDNAVVALGRYDVDLATYGGICTSYAP
ncbi:MAG: hypothetical protein IJG59_06360 [Erysipelotrichaceae bacterium]|nr:hypothetical protein [Erysipelotrichaceae bacterium]